MAQCMDKADKQDTRPAAYRRAFSYELLKWAGRSDNIVVKVLSLPGLYLQKLTTNERTISSLRWP